MLSSFTPRRAWCASTLAVTLISAGLAAAVPAGAATAAATGGTSAPPTSADAPLSGGSATADYYQAVAMKRATATGRPAEVVQLTTETTKTMANPDGTFTLTSNPRPVRAKSGGSWADIDNTLAATADGAIRPAVTTVPMEFSAGGSDPLVRLGSGDREMSVRWDVSLPAPTLEGDTATYREVLPGVDLVARADGDVYSHVLVVKSAEAARNPKLASLSFGLDSSALTFRAGRGGDVAAYDEAGNRAFSASAPVMWDTGTVDTQGSRRGSPDPDSTMRTMPIALQGDRLTVTPDRGLLTDPDTRFPVYIDPTWGGNKLAWTMVDKKYNTSTYYNSSDEARVGYETDTYTTKRSLFRMDTSGIKGKQILSATFRTVETWAWSCNARPVQAWATNSFSSGTTWNTQPTWSYVQSERNVAYGWHLSGQASPCPGNGGGVEFDVKTQAVKAAAGSWSNMTIGLKAKDETDTYGWKRFKNNPTLSVTYDSLPLTPTTMTTVPGTTCTGGAIGNTDLKLSAVPKDPDGGTVTAEFAYWKSGGSTVTRSVNVTSGVAASTEIVKSSLSNGLWYWKVRTYSGGDYSAYTTTCSFTVDQTAPPVAVTVSSTAYPATPSGTEPVMGQYAGEPGAFTIDAVSTDVVGFYVGLNDPQPTTYVAANAAGGTATVNLVPTQDMANRVYIKTKDAVGNVSTTTWSDYEFYAPLRPAPAQAVYKDLSNDGHPDVVGVKSSGEVCLYMGAGSGAASTFWKPGSSSCGVKIDSGRTAAMFKPVMTDWNLDGYSDVLTLADVDGNGVGERIQIFYGQGTGAYNTGALTLTDDMDADLTSLSFTRLFAVGDWDHDESPDLMATDSAGGMWLMRSDGYGRLILDPTTSTVATKVGSGWGPYYVLAPGDVNKDGNADLLARDSSGYLYLYPGNGAIGFTPRVLEGSNWNIYNVIVPMGDWNHDGTADIEGRDANGAFWYYNGTQSSAAPFLQSRIQTGSGWNMFGWVF